MVQRPEEIYDKTDEEAEKIIMEKVKGIANSIHSSIKVKVDYPTLHANQRIPILDTEMWIEEVEINGIKKHQILYSYYEKEMSSKYLIHNNSAISRGSKMNILVNELLRVMKNTSLRVNEDQKNENIQHFINKMQFSGYDQEDRIIVYKKAKKIFTEKVNGTHVYPHADKFTRQKKLTRERIQQKKTWFSKGKYKSVFYVDVTPNSQLARECQKVLNKCNVPIKVMEKTGESIKKMLTKSNPFKDKHCNDANCPVCLRDCGINCRTKDLVYENYCEHHNVCEGKYIGETADAIKRRFEKHLDDYRLRPQKSTMHTHSVEHHKGNEVEYKVKILGTCTSDALLRQCMEAVAIRDRKPIMNGREEWGTNKDKKTQSTRKGKCNKNSDTVSETSAPSGIKTKMSNEQVLNLVTSKVLPTAQLLESVISKGPNNEMKTALRTQQSNRGSVCWKCHLICKNERGLKIHQHTCLRKATSTTSFFGDERFNTNCHLKDTNELRIINEQKILPTSQPLEPLTSANKNRRSDVK